MGKQIAQFLWVGPGLSPLESLCLQSFLDVGYEVHLYTYEPMQAVPDGVIMKDAGEIIATDDTFFGPYTCGGRYAQFADRFRYYLLFERGGWWFDTDFVALKLAPEPTDLLVASQWEGSRGEYPCNSPIWSKPGDPRMAWMKTHCDRILAESKDLEYTALGPQLIGQMVKEFDVRVAPWWEFNPCPYYRLNRLVYSTNREWLVDIVRSVVHRIKQATLRDFRAAYIRRNSRAIHLSNEVWRDRGIDKTKLYHPGSIYGKLQRKHGFKAPVAART